MHSKITTKKFYSLTCVILFTVFLFDNMQLQAQERSAYRAGYIRLGFTSLGNSLDNNLSPLQNILKGNYGASSGFVFETGRVFYFMKKDKRRLVNLGLDWTYSSLNYNKMDKWDAYGKASGSPEYAVEDTKIAAAISSKLGPVVSFNPIENLVIDIRAQIAPTIRYFDLNYTEDNGNTITRYFSFVDDQAQNEDEGFNAESIKNRIAFGFQKSFGLTIRRKAIGLALDYISGNVKSTYQSEDISGSSHGKANIPVSNLQIKVSLTL
ncbi:hypothetical protein [Pedobacter sp. L105]|uniref:hypothetical protein n=1 Tax=Pedobacter sp. L105 TaxID=1641871 RepID=UPI00131C6FDC|nr:hypothetical protein [Pedobacter sp. L105]